LAGVVIILLALESEGMFLNLAMGKMIEMTDEEMSRVYFVFKRGDILELNRFDFGCEFDGDFDCWQRMMFPQNDLEDFIPHPQRPTKYNLIIMTDRGTGKFIIPPKEIRRGSITHFYNKEKMHYESVWYE
jgi:hypothetical protein